MRRANDEPVSARKGSSGLLPSENAQLFTIKFSGKWEPGGYG